jgi:hypothetical protein
MEKTSSSSVIVTRHHNGDYKRKEEQPMTAAAKVLTDEVADVERRPDLNGLIMKIPGQDALYLILDGYKCHIPNPQTLANLFVTGFTITQDANLNEITTGTPLAADAVLAQAPGTGVYLISFDPTPLSTAIVKMGIVNPTIFARYQFNTAKVVPVPLVVLQGIPSGPNVPPQTL